MVRHFIPFNDTYDNGEILGNDMSGDGTEEEEAVYGAIKPLSKYLVSINVDVDVIKQVMADQNYPEDIEDYAGPSASSVRGLLRGLLPRLDKMGVLNRVTP